MIEARHEQAVEQLNGILQELRIDPPEVKNQTLTPSQADLGWCPRKLYFKLTGETAKRRTTLQAQLRMEMGNCIHEVIQTWIKRKLPETLIEFVVPDTEMLGITSRARVDLIIAELLKGEYDFLGEIKSCGDAYFKKYVKNTPQSHYFQMLMTAALLKLWQPGILILVNRNTGTPHAKLVDLTEEAWAKELAELAKFKETYVDSGILPPLPVGKSSFLCSTCDYYHKCFGRRQPKTGALARSKVFKRRS